MTEAAIPQENVRRLNSFLRTETIPHSDSHYFNDTTVPPSDWDRDENAVRQRVMDAIGEERRRISVELHDSTLQHLAVVSLGLAQFRSLIDMTPEVSHLFREIAVSIDAAAHEIRAFSYLLHPPHIEQLCLDGTIRDFASGFMRRTEIAVELDMKGDLDCIPGELRTPIFRIVQEAFMNVYRHANASAVTLSLIVQNNAAQLRISDNGRGLAKNGSLGVGIPGMRDRVRQAGGMFEIVSDDRGTHISAILPIA